MGLLRLFSGKTPETYERKGDALVRDQMWGEAKLAYESAIDLMSKRSIDDPDMAGRLGEKLDQTKDSLAREHHRDALELMDADCMQEAHELFTLAFELTKDQQLKEELAHKIRQTTVQDIALLNGSDKTYSVEHPSEADPFANDTDDLFSLLLARLPEEVQQAYQGYGEHFKQGYLALNQGAFDRAVSYLKLAAQENVSSRSLVPLELATAYVNSGQAETARHLLEKLVQQHPDLLPAYQLLCEIYWEHQQFDKALELLDSLAPDLAKSVVAFQIRGETLLQAARYDEAVTYFQDLHEIYGWHEPFVIGLARSHEGLGRVNEARDVYRSVIRQCSGCGSQIDPAMKRKYADLCLDAGDYNTEALEYYLALSQEDPENAVTYYQNISRIYTAMGNDSESRRFLSIAEHLLQKQQDSQF
jgi:tetratricopeptide (TPR) repeat protein